MPHLLILGGTTEASALAKIVYEQGIAATFSYAGRVAAPKAQPLPTRVGGFGGVEGLTRYIRDNGITHVVDATHPFAAQMSANAVAACAATGTQLVALTRAPWVPEVGDNWIHVNDIGAAAEALGGDRKRVFLAIGRMHLDDFARLPQHFYLLRLVDQPGPLPLPDAQAIVDTGPFTVEGDRALMEDYAIDIVVSKNAGGTGARAKLEAARALGLPVVMIDRPDLPDRMEVHDVDAVMTWLAHAGTDLGV
ncbi:cobalt-precorrin-6A reductase [Chachezhania sediminis]|uniref:cobalt-precorrin-6A reductase n=1 Tax=Chachezhania sediminis TaxID=2599291 RepID=UPI00131BCC5F|nr:cobalt-precorrin-6A reductase [Chachezhania sediminis]